MTEPTDIEIAARLRAEAEASCDDELAHWLHIAAKRLDPQAHTRCRDCERMAELRGLCRRCYQRERRSQA